MPAVLLSIRATNLTKQGSRSMSPFVTCHWGTSRAAGTPSGVLDQEGVLQLPVSGRFSSCPALFPWDTATQMSPAICLGQSDLQSTHLDGRLHQESTRQSKDGDDLETHLRQEIPSGESNPWSRIDALFTLLFLAIHTCSLQYVGHCCFDRLIPGQ